jgi:hypothetical protein
MPASFFMNASSHPHKLRQFPSAHFKEMRARWARRSLFFSERSQRFFRELFPGHVFFDELLAGGSDAEIIGGIVYEVLNFFGDLLRGYGVNEESYLAVFQNFRGGGRAAQNYRQARGHRPVIVISISIPRLLSKFFLRAF